MPRKRVNKSPSIERRSDGEDDDFFFDDSQSSSGRNTHEPQHRNAANARERARMRVLSKAFCRKYRELELDRRHVSITFAFPVDENQIVRMVKKTKALKTTLPWVPADTKLSKLDTLRLAASYIAHLRALLQDEPRVAAQMFPHPLNLAWPFAFQHGGSVSCTATPRWNTHSPSCSAEPVTQEKSQSTPLGRDSPSNFVPEHYSQEYPTSDYEKRRYHEENMVTNTLSPCDSPVQYCNYGYKETYYELRSS